MAGREENVRISAMEPAIKAEAWAVWQKIGAAKCVALFILFVPDRKT